MKITDDILQLVETVTKHAVAQTIRELKSNNLLVDGKQTPHRKVEMLLYNYNHFVGAIKDKEEQIEEVKSYGVRKHVSSGMCSSVGYVDVQTEMEKAEDKIDQIEDSIRMTRKYVKLIDEALEDLKSDPYYDALVMRYFEGKSRDEIATVMQCDGRTVNRNTSRLIDLLAIRLFPDDVVVSILCS